MMKPGQIRDDLDSILEQWARWRSSSDGYGRSIMDRMLSGMPSTRCPQCAHSRRPGEILQRVEKTYQYVECPRCGGRGRLYMNVRGKVNPALIPSTAPYTGGEYSWRIEDIVMQHLSDEQRRVLIERYCGLGRHQDKAARLRMSPRTFGRILQTARAIVEVHLAGRAPVVVSAGRSKFDMATFSNNLAITREN